MPELLPSTSQKTPTQQLALGLLIDHSDPITSCDPNVEIQHTDEPDRKIDSPLVVMVEEEEEVGLLNALERDFYQLTIEQAEIETGRDRPGAVNEDDVGKFKLGEASVGQESQNVSTAELHDLHEEKGGKNAQRFEDESENVMGYMENEGTLKFNNVLEENVDKIEVGVEDKIVNRFGYMEETEELDNLHEEKGEKNAQSVEDEKNRWCYMDNVRVNQENEGAAMKFGRSNECNYTKGINYPMRPDADDCTFYMRFGSCKFGANCKFNHPPRRKNQWAKERTCPSEENSERTGQAECKYYMTSAGCRYGKDCKYSHGSDKISMSHHSLEFNFLGLPIRPEEKECSYYMRTGTCKYGSNCRFHHPEPTTVGDSDSPSGYGNGGSIPSQVVSSSSWSSPRAFNEASSLTPLMFSPAQGAPFSDSEWNSSQKFEGATYPTSERSLPTPPTFSLNNLPTEINFPMQHRHGMVLEEYPERPGEPECVFFMKTGECKFKSNCKFHHPKNHISKARANQCTLNDKGLPLRPDQPICTHYHRYGICKYGPACKYDHPSSFGNLPKPFDHQPTF